MRATGRTGKSLVLIFAMAVTLIMTSIPVFAATADPTGAVAGPDLGKNGLDAKSIYQTGDRILDASNATNADQLNQFLERAGTGASSGMWMVYVPGNKTISVAKGTVIKVPRNVVLVSENNTHYNGVSGKKLVTVSGSVYGGVFDGNNKNIEILCWLNYEKFSGKNGEIRKTTLQNVKTDGIHYGSKDNNKTLGNAKAIGNTIHHSGTNGLTAMNGGDFKEISGNNIYTVGTKKKGSGLNIILSDVDKISNNTIKNTKGHGISTDTDFKVKRKKVKINCIENNTIKNAGVHGIWVDKKVTIIRVSKNKIKKSKKCNIAIEKNGRINLLEYNTIQRPKLTSIHLNGKKSRLTVGNGNKVINSRCGINIQRGAYVKIKGKKNVFKKNGAGIYVCKGGKLKFSKSKRKKNKIKAIRHE